MQDYYGLVRYENTFDPELAKKLIAESGFDTNKVLKITTTNYYSDSPKAAQSIANNLSAIGIKTEIETVDINTFFSKMMSGGIEIAVSGWGGIGNLISVMGYASTKGDMTGGNMSNTQAKSQAYDDAFAAFQQTIKNEDKIANMKKVLEIFQGMYVYLPLYVPSTNVVFTSELQNLTPNTYLWTPDAASWSFK